MSRLWVRLALAFLLVSVLSVGAVAFFANRQVEAQFQHFVVQSRITEQGLDEFLAAYYVETGGWKGAAQALDDLRPGRGPAGNGMMMGRSEMVVADAQWRTVVPETQAGAILSQSDREIATPVRLNGDTIGYVLVRAPAGMQLTAAANAFLSQINRSLLMAAVFAALAGALMGVWIARSVSRPLSALAAAARKVAQGKLNERVPVEGSEEVANVANAFNEMTLALQRDQVLRRNMAADIAHELRTPLTVIQGNLRAILDDVYPMSKQEVALVFDETVTLSRLVNDLRDLSLAEAGQLSMNLTEESIAGLISQTSSHWRELFEEKGVALRVNVDDGLPAVRVDAGRMAQVLNNLLANALRHTPATGEVVIEATQTPAGVCVTITDSGEGISDDDLPHVFDRFWRKDESRAREGGGSGLGLAIARQYVEAMHGEIEVATPPGAGARFSITLPTVRA